MVRIRLKSESETLRLPELKPPIGKTVDIIIREDSVPETTTGSGDWDAAQQLRESGYDFDAWRRRREVEPAHADCHVP